LRYSNVLRIRTYIDRLSDGDRKAMPLPWPLTPAAVNQHRNSTHEDMSEFMITGLRLTREGVSEAEFSSRFGAGLEDVYGEAIERLIRLDLLEWVALGPHETRTGMPANNGPERLRLTPGARLLANQVFIAFVD
jgi:coproporphyrinogen III oxidase-like Fe-S oxidoreductase